MITELAIGAGATAAAGAAFLFRPTRKVTPASVHPLQPSVGKLVPLALDPGRIWALGLTYAAHVNETGGVAGAQPEVFEKSIASLLRKGDEVPIPSHEQMVAAIDSLEPGLGAEVQRRFPKLAPMMDYEVELGLQLLEDTPAAILREQHHAPAVAYFLANDLTVRTVQVLGEGSPRRMDFWSAAKSFPGFLVTGPVAWIPHSRAAHACLSVTLRTRVNGHERQQGSTLDLIRTPRELLLAAAERSRDGVLHEGDVVLTGTPAGVAFSVPVWKRRLSTPLPRLSKLGAALRSHAQNPRMLRSADIVEIDGGVLGSRTVRMSASRR